MITIMIPTRPKLVTVQCSGELVRAFVSCNVSVQKITADECDNCATEFTLDGVCIAVVSFFEIDNGTA